MDTVKEKENTCFKKLKDEFGYTNAMEAPVLQKVVVNTGIGSVRDTDKIKLIQDRLAQITGQKPTPTKAKKSISSFDIRAGDVIGYKVTLRGDRMYSFVDKLINIALPRTKDFRGVSLESIDEMGNITLGIDQHTVFPETSDEELKNVFSFSVTIVTSADDSNEAKEFLQHIGVPFADPEDEDTE
ncbi:MAG: 50S ribosomal protein L5 [Parcubacteria group bacterium SW_4_46_8]|nr:MAG: 50S ribosomal protein L5 [Parcubacteria group bacterium SW_4_46_8]